MNFPFYIARRYLFAKKSHHIINIISGISVVGVTIATLALIVVLSVFNGFEKLVISLFSTFNPEVQITIKEGKVFSLDKSSAERIKALPSVAYYTDVVEENALLKYKSKQFIVTMKGVSSDYLKMSHIDTMMVDGKFILENGQNDFAVIGAGIASKLDINLKDFQKPITVYLPKRSKSITLDPLNAFNSENILPMGVFSIQQDIDIKYIFVPLRFARNLLDYKNEVTSVELGLQSGSDPSHVISEIKKIIGNKYQVKDRFQQQEILFKIMKSEKLSIFLILSFILLIATVNIIGTLTLLILDKKKDIAILTSLGADQKLIRKIFFLEGMMISLTGAVFGLLSGGIICWLQQEYKLVKLPPEGTFIINAYPIHLQFPDFIFVFLIVVLVGIIAVWYPVRKISQMMTTKFY